MHACENTDMRLVAASFAPFDVTPKPRSFGSGNRHNLRNGINRFAEYKQKEPKIDSLNWTEIEQKNKDGRNALIRKT